MTFSHRERGGILWKLLTLIAVLLFLFVIYLLRKPMLRETARLLVVDEKLAPADAILVLGDDNYAGERARHAAKLYRERWAPRVVASGRYIRPYANIADLIQRDLVQNGVPAEHILAAPSRVENTREEAFAMRRIMREQRWRRVIVVTSNYHTRRTRYIFYRALDPGTELLVSAAEDSGFPIQNWWESRSGWKTFIREVASWPVAIWEMSDDAPAPAAQPASPAPARP